MTGLLHRAGTVSMARGGPDTATSEIFILLDDQPSLDFGGRRFEDGQAALRSAGSSPAWMWFA